MQSLLPQRYPVDTTGSSVTNAIVGEPHLLVKRKSRAIAPMSAPYFKKSLSITDNLTGKKLNAAQYKCLDIVPLPSAIAGIGNEVYSIIIITDESVSDSVSLNYQTIGGDYVRSFETTKVLLEALTADTRPSAWPNVINRPDSFEPSLHLHAVGDAVGWEYIAAALDQLKNVILLGDSIGHEELLTYIDEQTTVLFDVINGSGASSLGVHTRDFQNPHRVTKAQVGLTDIQNYPPATASDIATPELNKQKYVTNDALRLYLNNFFAAYSPELAAAILYVKTAADEALKVANRCNDNVLASEKLARSLLQKFIDEQALIPKITDYALPAEVDWSGVTFGNGTFVAISYDSDLVAVSTDGTGWMISALPVVAKWTSIAFGNDIFVAIAAENAIVATSTDGIDWETQLLPVKNDWRFVGYYNGKFTAMAIDSQIAVTSTDGIIWMRTSNNTFFVSELLSVGSLEPVVAKLLNTGSLTVPKTVKSISITGRGGAGTNASPGTAAVAPIAAIESYYKPVYSTSYIWDSGVFESNNPHTGDNYMPAGAIIIANGIFPPPSSAGQKLRVGKFVNSLGLPPNAVGNQAWNSIEEHMLTASSTAPYSWQTSDFVYNNVFTNTHYMIPGAIIVVDGGFPPASSPGQKMLIGKFSVLGVNRPPAPSGSIYYDNITAYWYTSLTVSQQTGSTYVPGIPGTPGVPSTADIPGTTGPSALVTIAGVTHTFPGNYGSTTPAITTKVVTVDALLASVVDYICPTNTLASIAYTVPPIPTTVSFINTGSLTIPKGTESIAMTGRGSPGSDYVAATAGQPYIAAGTGQPYIAPTSGQSYIESSPGQPYIAASQPTYATKSVGYTAYGTLGGPSNCPAPYYQSGSLINQPEINTQSWWCQKDELTMTSPGSPGQPYIAPTSGQPYIAASPGQPYIAPAPGQPYIAPVAGQPYIAAVAGQPYIAAVNHYWWRPRPSVFESSKTTPYQGIPNGWDAATPTVAPTAMGQTTTIFYQVANLNYELYSAILDSFLTGSTPEQAYIAAVAGQPYIASSPGQPYIAPGAGQPYIAPVAAIAATTGASSVVTIAGATYTFPGGTGSAVPALTTKTATLSAATAASVTYSCPSGASVSGLYSAPSNATSSLTTAVTLGSIAFGNNKSAAVSLSNLVADSSDAILFRQRITPNAAAKWKSVAYGNGVFMAIASNSAQAATSVDGVTWTSIAMSANLNWQSVAYGNGVFVAVATKSKTSVSIGARLVTAGTAPPVPSYALAVSSTAVNEGSTVNFTLTTTNVANGTKLYYAIAGAGVQASDFVDGSLTGSLLISNNAASFSKVIANDGAAEASETFTTTLRAASVSGVVLAAASAVTIARS